MPAGAYAYAQATPSIRHERASRDSADRPNQRSPRPVELRVTTARVPLFCDTALAGRVEQFNKVAGLGFASVPDGSSLDQIKRTFVSVLPGMPGRPGWLVRLCAPAESAEGPMARGFGRGAVKHSRNPP
jgi:hypothetical protein